MSELVSHLKKEKERLLRLVSSIDVLIAEYSDLSVNVIETKISTPNKASSSLRKGVSLKESVKSAALSLTQFTKSTDITKMLFDIYPDKANNPAFQVQVSGILSDWGKKNVICKFQYSTSKKDTVWGKPEWLDEKGQPKDEFFDWNVI